MVTTKKIGVLLGGLSSEREVSLASGRAIVKALEEKGYRPASLDVDQDIARKIREQSVEVAFIALHGRFGEDGAIQGLLEVMGIPYTGSGILASALGMNKIASKQIFRAQGLHVGAYEVASSAHMGRVEDAVERIGYPAVIKPSAEGSSVGVSLVYNKEEIASARECAFRYGPEILIEKFIKGREVQVGILGDRALGAIEIVPKRAFYDYSAKYEPGMSDHFFPARIPGEVYQKTLAAGLAAHRALGCRGYSRVDFIVDEQGDPYILEVNTLPGMTATSLLPDIARGVGISFPDLAEEILRLALEGA
ncbi:MAG TPA: D-alanine--D-alanine ligase [Nitrospirota bacterium]|nr:D-alanine--D-alanine ligase [Nitrospirota bacterium]